MNTYTKILWELLSANDVELKRWQIASIQYPIIHELADKIEDHFTKRFQSVQINGVDYLSTAIFFEFLKDAFEKVNFYEIAELISTSGKKSDRANLMDFQGKRITDLS